MGAGGVGPPLSAPQQLIQQSGLNVTDNLAGFSRPTTSVSSAITSGESGVETAATGSEVGELFEYRVEQPVTVRRDRSALIPILQTKMEGERVSVYNEAARKDRPMHGIRLKNTSELTLEGGSLTVIDGDAYAGEALIERLKSDRQETDRLRRTPVPRRLEAFRRHAEARLADDQFLPFPSRSRAPRDVRAARN